MSRLLLRLAFLALVVASWAQELISTHTVETLADDLQIQEWMRELRRVKRAPTRNVQPVIVVLPGFDPSKASPYFFDLHYPEPLRRHRAKRAKFCPILGGPGTRCERIVVSSSAIEDDEQDSDDTQRLSTVVLGANSTGRCVLSADRASHFCGMEEEVSAPPIPPPDAGKCIISKASGREICYPRYEELDTTCTDVTGKTTHGLVAPPVVLHATVRAMAFVPPDNLRRLIIQYYRQQGRYMPKNATFSPRIF
uniref:Clip domain-containing protein n=1 Tax=Heterorhabditis bacteriophora TaxID=37862 RepID=A0A1I7XGE8_HETBA